jgi:hypothetical protein
MPNGTGILEESLKLLAELNMLLPYEPAVFFAIYPQELSAYINTKTCMWIETPCNSPRWYSGKGKTMRTAKLSVGDRGWG